MCCLFEKTENKQKEARVGPFLKKEKEKKITELFFYSFYSDHLLLLLLSFDETEKEFQKNFFFVFRFSGQQQFTSRIEHFERCWPSATR